MALIAQNPTTMPAIGDAPAYFFLVVGILASVAVPAAVKLLKTAGAIKQQSQRGLAALLSPVWAFIKPYLLVCIASLILGLVVMALFLNGGGTFTRWYQAFVVGYLWDSTLQKVKEGLR